MKQVKVKRVRASEMELKDKVVTINRVTKTTKGGRTFSFSVVVVVGNENGIVGCGLGKAKEVQKAIAKAIDDAKKNLVEISKHKDTIPHEVYLKHGASKVLIKPASHGTGVIAGGSMRAVLESAGIKDVLAKNFGSSNPQNVVKATVAALKELRTPYQVAKQRGVSLQHLFE